MKRIIYSFFVLSILAIISVNIGLQAYAAEGNVSEIGIGELINQERINNGLTPYILSLPLVLSSKTKGLDMFSNNYWAHTSPSGRTPFSIMYNSGYYYIYAGENLAYGYSSSEDVFYAWMNSPGHKANIVNKSFKDMGISVTRGNLQGSENTILVVTHFGVRR